VSQPGVVDTTGNVPFIMSPRMTDLSSVSAVASRYTFRARDSDKRDRAKSSSNLCLDTRLRLVGNVTLSPALPSWKTAPVCLWKRMNTIPTARVKWRKCCFDDALSSVTVHQQADCGSDER